MWQDTTRKLKETVRARPGKFWRGSGVGWAVLILVLSLAGVLAVMVVALKRP